MTAAGTLLDAFAPYLVDDDGSLATYLTACAQGRELVDDLVRDTDDGPGWSSLLDPDRCPAYALRWLAQLVGISLAPGTDEATARTRIRTPIGWRRGTVQAMRDVVTPTLTGTQAVFILERTSGVWTGTDNPYHFTVATFTDETPDVAATTAAAQSQKPAGLVMSVLQISHWVYLTLITHDATYAAVVSEFATYAALKTGP